MGIGNVRTTTKVRPWSFPLRSRKSQVENLIPTTLPVSQSVSQSVSLSVCLSVCLSVRPSPPTRVAVGTRLVGVWFRVDGISDDAIKTRRRPKSFFSRRAFHQEQQQSLLLCYEAFVLLLPWWVRLLLQCCCPFSFSCQSFTILPLVLVGFPRQGPRQPLLQPW